MTIPKIYYKIKIVGDKMKNGFTLVEFISIMVVVSVMTLVSAPLVSKELKDVKKEEAVTKSNLVKQSLKAYYYQNNKLPKF